MTKTFVRRLTALLLIINASMPLFSATAESRRGEKSFGPYVGYVTRNSSATAGLSFEYTLSSVVRIAPEIGVIFRNRDLGGLTVDVNTHFPLSFAAGKAAFYPLAGLNFTSWSLNGIDPVTSDDVTTHRSRFGLNAGAGVEYFCKPSLKLSVECRYTLMQTYPTAFATAGISFVF